MTKSEKEEEKVLPKDGDLNEKEKVVEKALDSKKDEINNSDDETSEPIDSIEKEDK